jgi:UDP-N-acetylmuramoylalanine--D-glutamate ligase
MARSTDARPARLCPASELRSLLGGIAGKPVTLMGLGVFGGGQGAARFLAEVGARLTATDLRPPHKLAETVAALRGLPIAYRLGQHLEHDFTAAALVVANPAVPRTNAYLRAAADAGVPITSPMNIFLSLCPARILAVTGSNGKSTTTALLALILERAGRRPRTGGNIGVSLLPQLSGMCPDDTVVLELSSFQLSDAAALPWSPHVAIVTNITPNHLDWHADLADYVRAKESIVRFQTADDLAVLNLRDPTLAGWTDRGLPGRIVLFSSAPELGCPGKGMYLIGKRLVWHGARRDEVVCSQADIPLPGAHNVENVLAASAAALSLGAAPEAVRRALHEFVGLEHRLQLIGEFGGVRFYNDSYSTTPESTAAAVASFPAPVVLLAGGYDKKLDLGLIARAAVSSAEVLITLGHTGPEIAHRARQEALCAGRSIVVREAASLADALDQVAELAMPGTVVIFSPGCASYDMFDNYRHRGLEFAANVRARFARTQLAGA